MIEAEPKDISMAALIPEKSNNSAIKTKVKPQNLQ